MSAEIPQSLDRIGEKAGRDLRLGKAIKENFTLLYGVWERMHKLKE